MHWSYEGETGPDNWGDLSAEYRLCGCGTAQSPIDLAAAKPVALVEIDFHYGESAAQIFHDGHNIHVMVDEGSTIVYNGITYDLLHFHFHHPAEHTIQGQAHSLEAHFVHQDRNSENLAVVGIVFREGMEKNERWAAIFDELPAEEGESLAKSSPLRLSDFLPESKAYYTYPGSLTTPPCSEIVRWLVMAEVVELSNTQIGAFADIFSHNARPVQPLGKRDLLFCGG